MEWFNVASNLIDSEVILESAALGIGFGLSALFNHLYRSHRDLHDNVRNATYVHITEHLHRAVMLKPMEYRYVALSGRVIADDNILKSRCFPEKEGVITNFVTMERKEIWAKYSQVWYESDRELSNITESVPFSLADGHASVHVADGHESPWISKCLTVVNKDFREPNSSVMDSLVGFVTGDRVKGYSDTEKMLLTGTRLLGIGELVVENGVLQLRKPAGGDLILSCASRADVVSLLGSKIRLWRLLRIIALGATLSGLYFYIKHLWKKYQMVINDQRSQNEIAEIRRRRQASDDVNTGDIADEDKCVVCLANKRECVILNCGHVCSCVDCVEALPPPKTCPMCRSPISRIVPLFHA